MGKMFFQDSFYFISATPGRVPGQGEYTVNNEVSLVETAAYRKKSVGGNNSQECHLNCMCF
jgi:hypothetical protein